VLEKELSQLEDYLRGEIQGLHKGFPKKAYESINKEHCLLALVQSNASGDQVRVQCSI
jgi:hypothetical protein